MSESRPESYWPHLYWLTVLEEQKSYTRAAEKLGISKSAISQKISELERVTGKTLLDAAHRAVLRAFEVPERDRYQIVHENKAHHMVIEDTGLGLTRTRDLVVVRVYTSPRSEAQKQRFFAILQEELAEHCGLSGDDLMVSIISNQKGDWSFGRGVAQYLTGDL